MSVSCAKHIENYWKIKTQIANEEFYEGNYASALAEYKEAFYRAEVLNSDIGVCKSAGVPFIQVYMISCNNLANTYEELGELEESENMLKRGLAFLLKLTQQYEKTSISLTELQSEAKKAVLNYCQFTQKYKLQK